uniref:Uncharacterized protein n=1 Tax=Globodera rostochiensis TaxID=31243 RepID=A0A914H703_GLORO
MSSSSVPLGFTSSAGQYCPKRWPSANAKNQRWHSESKAQKEKTDVIHEFIKQTNKQITTNSLGDQISF